MPSYLHISDDIAKPRQTSFTNTPRKINFLLDKVNQKKRRNCHQFFCSAFSSFYWGKIPYTGYTTDYFCSELNSTSPIYTLSGEPKYILRHFTSDSEI